MENNLELAVVEFNSSGGLIHYAYQMCTALSEQKIDVTLITGSDYELKDFPHNFRVQNILNVWPVFDPASMQLPPDDRLLRKWVKIKWVLRRGIRAVQLIREWIRLTNYLIQSKPNLVQFGEIKFPFEAIFLARLRRNGLRLSQICHEFERRETRTGFSRIMDRISAGVFLNFAVIFFHARQNRDRFLSIYHYPLENTHMIPMGNEAMFLTAASTMGDDENLRQRYGITDDDRVVLFFGTLAPSKGVADLIDAFAIVQQATAATLVIAGYPSKYMDMNALKQKVTDNALSGHVIFDTRYIPIQSVKPLMDLATLVVFPYHNATQSGAMQVAYAFGRPVIATAVGGLPEEVEDGHSGYLVPPGDTEKMAVKIISLLESPQLAAQMGEHARHLSETRYSWNLIAKKLADVYQGLVGQYHQ